MNEPKPRKYGKDVLLNFGVVHAEVYRDDGDHHISVERRTFGNELLKFLNDDVKNFAAAHAWADKKIELLIANETPSNKNEFDARQKLWSDGYRAGKESREP